MSVTTKGRMPYLLTLRSDGTYRKDRNIVELARDVGARDFIFGDLCTSLSGYFLTEPQLRQFYNQAQQEKE